MGKGGQPKAVRPFYAINPCAKKRADGHQYAASRWIGWLFWDPLHQRILDGYVVCCFGAGGRSAPASVAKGREPTLLEIGHINVIGFQTRFLVRPHPRFGIL